MALSALLRMAFLAMALLGCAATSHAEGFDYTQLTGKELYERFCASCHGADGRGDGPVASALAVEVPDLRLIARRNRDVFPRERVASIIDGRHVLAAHGARTMPVWGQEFSDVQAGSGDGARAARNLIARLADYVWLLQRPAAK